MYRPIISAFFLPPSPSHSPPSLPLSLTPSLSLSFPPSLPPSLPPSPLYDNLYDSQQKYMSCYFLTHLDQEDQRTCILTTSAFDLY